MKLDVTKDVKEVERLFRDLSSRDINRVTAYGINDTLADIKKEVAPIVHREISESTGITKSGVNRALRIYRAKAYDTYGSIRVRGGPIPLIYFGARKVEQGVSYKDGQKRVTLEGAFIAKAPNSKARNVWKRTGRPKVVTRKGRYAGTGIKREPIAKQYGPSLPDKFSTETVQGSMNAVGARQWPVRFGAAFESFLRKRGK